MIHRKHSVCGLVTITIALLTCISATKCTAQGRFQEPSLPSVSSDVVNIRQNLRLQSLEKASKPLLGVRIKDVVKTSDYTGVRVDAVVPNSPAEKAGIRIDDVIIQIADTAITSQEVLIQTVSKLQVGADYPVTLVRNGRLLELRVRLEPQLKSQPRSLLAESSLEISDKPAPRKGFMDINVLKYVLIDPKTYNVTFLGKYDPTYDTGPIPYGDYLRVALQYPYPSFSLDPPAETLESLKKAKQILDAEMARLEDPNYANQWTQKIADLLINDPTLQIDNKRFFEHCANVMGITGDELKRMHDAATGKIDMPGTEFMGLASKMIRGIGLTKAGDALGVLAAGGIPEELLYKMAQVLGLSAEYDELAKKGLSPEDFRKEEIILCISEICRYFEAPEEEIQSIVSSIRSGQSADLIIDYMGKKLSDYISNKSGRKMIDGLVLGPEIIAKLYNLPLPRTELVFRDLPPESLLGDVFFKSDYRLKSVCTFPDAKDRVKTHLTQQEFMKREATAAMNRKLCNVSVLAGNTLVPGEVMMRISPSGHLVEFEQSKIKITGWIMELRGRTDKETTDFVNSSVSKYADYLTDHYEEYAKVYPEWHKLSEAAKIIALARWANANGYSLRTANESEAKISPPKYVNGFWSAVFEVDDNSQYLTFIAEGGTSFAKKEGESWLKIQQDVTVTSDVSKQLAASAVFAEQALGAAISGDLESARELAEKSAQAMVGEIDLTRLPPLDASNIPSELASYAAVTGAAIDEAAKCLDKMNAARKDLERAQQITVSSPDEAEKLKNQAIQIQEEAQAKLNQILEQVKNYRSDPSKAEEALVVLRGDSAIVAPNRGSSSSASSNTTSQSSSNVTVTSKSENWAEKCSKLAAELDNINKQIAVTREALLKLNASILANKKLFEEWESSASEAFDRCVGMAADVALDFGISGLVERYDKIYELAKKLPGEPKDVIEKYRYLASLIQRLSEAKAVKDVDDLASRENKTEAEIWETLRDGVGQISGLLGLDKTIPGKWWKYGSMAFDLAFNLTEMRETWKNIEALEANNRMYAEAVRKLTTRMKELVDRQREINQKIEAGESAENTSQ
jgi:hypothetical protein